MYRAKRAEEPCELYRTRLGYAFDQHAALILPDPEEFRELHPILKPVSAFGIATLYLLTLVPASVMGYRESFRMLEKYEPTPDTSATSEPRSP